MCARGDFSSLSVLSTSTPATGYQAPPPIFIDGKNLSRELFFYFKITILGRRFFFLKFFIPRGGSYAMLPYGVPFDSLSFLYLPSGHFFELKIPFGLSRFFLNFFIPRCGS